MNDIKDLLSKAVNSNDSGITYPQPEAPLHLSLSDLLGKPLSHRTISGKERFIVRALIHYAATKSGTTERKLRSEVKRFINVSRLENLDVRQYEAAVDYLSSRAS